MPHKCPNTVDKRYSNICFLLFVAGAGIGLFQLSAPVPFGDGFEMVALAKNLASHATFANPFWILDTGPTAVNPPLYPFLLAVLIKVLKFPPLVLVAAATGNIAANALTASLLPRASRLLYGDMMPGIVASILWLGSAQLVPAWDTGCTVAGLIIFCLFTASLLGPEKNMAFSFFAGGIAGLLILLNPSSLMVLLPWVAYLAVRSKLRLKEIVCLLAILSLIVFAWAARNRLRLGAFAVRTNLGMTLYASNNDCAAPSMIADQLHNCYQSHHPNTSLSEAQLLSTLGEAKYDRKRTADVMNWIKTHPSRFWLLTLARCREFWFPPLQPHPYSTSVIWTATALSIPGLLLMIYRFHPATPYVLAVLFIYPPIYYVVVSDVRYRYPVLWLSLLPAGYCVCQLLSNQLEWVRLGKPIRDEHAH